MKVTSSEAIPTIRALSSNFTGTAWREMLLHAPAPANVHAVRVSYEPGARTVWHTHPLGQALYVLSGIGLVQCWGEKSRVIKPGDVVWFSPGEKHWHGATLGNSMTHIAIQEAVDGEAADWLEPVTDDQYSEASI